MANCKNCGQPLTKGNIKFVRKPGKRPYRVCRRCRYPDEVEVTRVGDKRRSFVVPPTREDGKPDLTVLEDFVQVPKVPGETAGDMVQRPQDTTGGPFTTEVVYLDSNPTRYRFFITQDQADKVKRALVRPAFNGMGIGLELIPVPDYQVDQEPDRFADLVEVTINGYNGGEA